MKYLIFLCGLFLGFSPANAQLKGKFEFGLQHSVNFPRLIGQGPKSSFGIVEIESIPIATRFTPSFGGFGNYYISNRLSVQFEIMAAFYGSHFSKEESVYQDLGFYKTSTRETYALRYLKIPVALDYHLNDQFYVQGGGYFSVLLNAKSYDGYVSFEETAKYVHYINPIDAGLMGGFGMNTRIVRVDFRYNYGFLNVFENRGGANLHTSVFELTAHWELRNRK